MVKKKYQSKRQTLKMKYKIQKNVKEHDKKLKKKAKKDIKNGWVKKKKNPGIPNSWPFKEKLIRQMERAKVREEAKEVADKEARRQARINKKIDEKAAAAEALEASAAAAMEESESEDEFAQEEAEFKETISRVRDVVEASDVVLCVLDARDPAGSRMPPLERLLARSGKRLAFYLSNLDLVAADHAAAWLARLSAEAPTAAYVPPTLAGGRRSPSAEGLLTLAAAYSATKAAEAAAEAAPPPQKKKKATKKKASAVAAPSTPPPVPTVGIVGFTHACPAEVMAALRGRFVHTCAPDEPLEQMGKETTDAQVRLLNVVGELHDWMGHADAVNTALTGAIEDPVAVVAGLLSRADRMSLMEAFTIPMFEGELEFLELMAEKRYVNQGKVLRRDKQVDLSEVALSFLKHFSTRGNVKFNVQAAKPATAGAAGGSGDDGEAAAAAAWALWGAEHEEALRALAEAQLPLVKGECAKGDQDDWIPMAPHTAEEGDDEDGDEEEDVLDFDLMLAAADVDSEEEEEEDEEDGDGMQQQEQEQEEEEEEDEEEEVEQPVAKKAKKAPKGKKGKKGGEAYSFGEFFG
jgi:nuclear GTP-binding protein